MIENRTVVFRDWDGGWLGRGTREDFGGDEHVDYFDGGVAMQIYPCVKLT